jgi:hypothetical protein
VSSRSRRLEVVACGLGLGLVALAMCLAHIRDGGLYYDDWSLLALARFPGSEGLLHGLWLGYGQRPGQVLYYAGLAHLLGADASARLALAAAMVVLQATCLFALLRRLRLGRLDAAAISGLSLTFPFSDSLWLWGVLSLTSLAIAAAMLGVMLALSAFQSRGARAIALHAASLALYVASILSYELFAVAGCLVGLLYVRVVGLRRARVRWLLDVVAIAGTLAFARAALPIDVATPSKMQSLPGMVSHAGEILGRGARLIGSAALPLGGLSPWLGLALIVAVLVGATVLRIRLTAAEEARAELGRWLAIAAAGVLVALAAWAVYVPASDHYAPTPVGTVNRINAAAGIGIAILLYACLRLAGMVLRRVARLPAHAAPAGVAIAALLLGGAYLRRSARDARAWDAAAADQRRLLADLHAALPRLGPGETVYAYDAPLLVSPGIPVLNTTLDLTSAVRISYSDPRLQGVPVLGGGVSCGPRGPLAAGVTGVYGRSYLLDVGARRAVALRARVQCLRIAVADPRSARSDRLASTGSREAAREAPSRGPRLGPRGG